MEKKCSTCEHAHWKNPKAGRRSQTGECIYLVSALSFPPIPTCITVTIKKGSIQPDMGGDCPTYTPKTL